jgi:hypothetical protein
VKKSLINFSTIIRLKEEKNSQNYPVTNKNKIINSILESCIKGFQIHKGDKKKSKFGEDPMLIKHILVRYEPEILKLSEIDNPTKVSNFDMSIKNDPRPEPINIFGKNKV